MAIRMSKTWLVKAALIIAVLALISSGLSCSSSLLGREAPDFTLPTLTGGSITLSELKGMPVVLNFWATWCGPCRGELPYFEAVAQQSAGNMTVIAISVGQTASTVQNVLQQVLGYEPTMKVALDTDGAVFVSYSQEDNPREFIPFTLFVDNEGLVQYLQVGAFTSEAALREKLYNVFGIAIP